MQPPAAPCQEPAEAVEDYPGFVFERVRDSILAEAGPRDEPHYADKLTVLLTTSPVVSNPDTTMIEVVLSTVAQIPGLLKCRFVVVCDGCCVLPAELFKTKARKSSYRGGRVPGEEGLAMYEEYKARVRELMARPGAFPGGAEVLELPSRHGFGMAVQEGLQHVHTPYVMVIQHDRAFCRPFDVAGLLECMEADPSLKMVALLNKSMYDHARRVLSCGRIKLPKEECVEAARTKCPREGICLRPLLAWLDSTHICPVEHYRTFVFGGGSGQRARLKLGGFIEDKLGQVQLQELRQEGFASHARHGTWIVDDGVEVRITGHLDGGHFRAWRKGWVKSVPGAAEALMQVGRGQAAEVREGSRSESDGSAGDDVDQSVAATVPVDADVSCDEWVAYELFT